MTQLSIIQVDRLCFISAVNTNYKLRIAYYYEENAVNYKFSASYQKIASNPLLNQQ